MWKWEFFFPALKMVAWSLALVSLLGMFNGSLFVSIVAFCFL